MKKLTTERAVAENVSKDLIGKLQDELNQLSKNQKIQKDNAQTMTDIGADYFTQKKQQ